MTRPPSWWLVDSDGRVTVLGMLVLLLLLWIFLGRIFLEIALQ